MPFNSYSYNPFQDYSRQQSSSSPFPQMRAKSIFAPPTTPEENTKRFLSQVNPTPKADFSQPDSSDSDENSASSYYQAMRKLQTKGPAVSAYQAALKEQPTEENTPISTARKIMGTIGGIAGGIARGPEGGISTANEIIGSPYRTAMRDYQVKMKNLGESAKLEQDDTDAQLKAMDNAQTHGLNYQKYLFEKDKERATEADRAAGRATASRVADTGAARQVTYAQDVKNRAGEAVLSAADREARTKLLGRDAATREKDASTRAAAQSETAQYHKNLIDKAGRPVTPSQQNFALDMAYRQLALDDRYKDFVQQNDKGFFEANPKMVNESSAVFREFRKRADKLAQDSINKGLIHLAPEDYAGDEEWSATIKRK